MRLLSLAAVGAVASGLETGAPATSSLYSLRATDIEGQVFDMSSLSGRVTLVVNVATY